MKIVITIIIIGILLVLGRGAIVGLRGHGAGDGSGGGNQVTEVSSEEMKETEVQNEAEAEDNNVIIRVEENQIYVGEEECTGVEELADKLSIINSRQGKDARFVFEHEYAIKATYDEVKQTLIDLEETLGISIDYRE